MSFGTLAPPVIRTDRSPGYYREIWASGERQRLVEPFRTFVGVFGSRFPFHVRERDTGKGYRCFRNESPEAAPGACGNNQCGTIVRDRCSREGRAGNGTACRIDRVRGTDESRVYLPLSRLLRSWARQGASGSTRDRSNRKSRFSRNAVSFRHHSMDSIPLLPEYP